MIWTVENKLDFQHDGAPTHYHRDIEIILMGVLQLDRSTKQRAIYSMGPLCPAYSARSLDRANGFLIVKKA